MSKKFVISRKNLQSRYPITESILILLLLEKYQVIDEIKGVVYCLIVLYWIAVGINRRDEIPLDINKEIK